MICFASLADRLLSFAAPWPPILAMDFTRYLLAAVGVSVALALASQAYVAGRRVRTREPAIGQRRHEITHSLVATVIFSLVGFGIYVGQSAGIFRIYSDMTQHSLVYLLGTFALILLAHDSYFYWTHRWAHRPGIFRWLHRVHHVSVAPTQWAAYSFSAGEALMQAGFLPLFLLAVPTHTSVLFAWMVFQVTRNAMGHCGVELLPRSWLASWWGRWCTTTLHHDMHHAGGRYHYSLYFTWWDRWCGTEHPEYRERLAQLVRTMKPAPIAASAARGS